MMEGVDKAESDGLRMGMLKQLRPMRSSPLLQQATLEPLPQAFSEVLESISTFLLPSEAPDWGTAKATAAMEATMRVLMKAIVDDWWFWWKGLGSECGIVDWIDCWMMRRS